MCELQGALKSTINTVLWVRFDPVLSSERSTRSLLILVNLLLILVLILIVGIESE